MLSASIANEKKALGVIILDVGAISSISDYIIICSGSSDRQVQAIADGIVRKTKMSGTRPLHIEGYSEGKWILIDLNDVIVHVFFEPVRSYYRLEELWSDAQSVALPKNYLDTFDDARENSG